MSKMREGNTTTTWQQYEKGVDYKSQIGLYSTVDLNERFYAGDQWVGIPHEGLPTPVVNFIKYASAWKIAAVTDRRLELSFFAEGESDGGDIGTYARQISAYCDMLWERLGMDYMTKEGLKQAAITGDYIHYFYWDDSKDTGQAVRGDIGGMLIDNVNYYPGNPNDPDVQSQPYIIIAFRELVSKVKEEAKKNGVKHLDEISADEETEYTSGDMGKIELDDGGKCNVLLKMWKKDGHVVCEKVTRNVVIQPEKDTKLTRYPLALMNWETRKNCCHGMAEVTGLIPNQVFVNKILALSQLNQVQTSFPKVIYDKTRIKQWSTKVAGAIPVSGDIDGAARYMNPPSMSYDAWKGLDVTIDQTMRMMGANDVTLGNIRNPDNTSAFIATRDAAMVPLQTQQERFYAMIEEVGRIWLDFIQHFYKSGRKIPVEMDGVKTYVPIDSQELGRYTLNLKVDVGPSTMWSEIQVLQTLDNLLASGQISLAQYLERIPDGHIPAKDKLLEELKQAETGAAPGGMPPMGAGLPPMAGGLPQMDGGLPQMGGALPPMGDALPPMDAGMPAADGGLPPMGGAMPLPKAAPGGKPDELLAALAGGGGKLPNMEAMKLPAAGAKPGKIKPQAGEKALPAVGAKPGKAKPQAGEKVLPTKDGKKNKVTEAFAAADQAEADWLALIDRLVGEGVLPAKTADLLKRLTEQEAGKDALAETVKMAVQDGDIGGAVRAELEAAMAKMG